VIPVGNVKRERERERIKQKRKERGNRPETFKCMQEEKLGSPKGFCSIYFRSELYTCKTS